MKISRWAIKNYRGIKGIVMDDLGNMVTLVGRNSSGKSAILEAIDFLFSNLAVAGGATSGVDEYYFFSRNTQKPAVFSVEVELDGEEVRSILSDNLHKMLEAILDRVPNRVIVSRNVNASGQWQTALISWGDFPLVRDNVTVAASDFRSNFDKKATEIVRTEGRAIPVLEVADQDINQTLTQLIEAMGARFVLVSAIRDTITPIGGRSAVLASDIQQNIQQLQQSLQKDDEEVYVHLERLYRELTGLRIDPIQGRLNVRRGATRIPLYLEGGGLQEACNVLYSLVIHQRQGRIIGLEEPETHMHPELQRKFFHIASQLAETMQMFIATHSPIFVGQTQSTDAWIVQFTDRQVSVKRIGDFRDALTELGVLPSDIYFANKVVFVEGPSDQIFLRAVAIKLGVDLRDVVLLSMEGKGNTTAVVSQWLEGTHGFVPLFVILDADAERVREELVSKRLLKKRETYVWKKGEIEDYYPPDIVKQAMETINEEYALDIDLDKVFKKIKTKGVKAAALDLGKKRAVIKDRWKVILARKVAEHIPTFEGDIDSEIQEVVQRLAE